MNRRRGERSGKAPENGKDFSQTISASAGETGGTDCERIRRDRGDSSGLSPIIPDVKCSAVEARASGADRWRRCNGAEWKRRELAESGYLPGVNL